MLFNRNKWLMCCKFINNIILKKNKNRSLQAQAAAWKQKTKKASGFIPCKNIEGSATVETMLVLPVFLSAVTVFFMMGQSMITEGKIQHAVTETALICAKQKSLEKPPDVITSFYSVFEMSSGDKSCIAGKNVGIRLFMEEQADGEYIRIKAVYRFKINFLFLGNYSFPREAIAVQRVFCGYLPHGGQSDNADPIVYVAKNGRVYHTDLSCSHICLTISGGAVEQIMNHSRLDACEKCVHKNERPFQLYITAFGDCYHSSLNCSGLKRSVKAVQLSELGNMRMCSRCASRSGTGG